MCAPGLSSILGMVQQNQQSKFQAESLEAQAKQEQLNAAEQANRFARNAERQVARVQALQSREGINTGVGSPLLIAEQIARDLELDRMTIGHGAQTRANSLNAQAGAVRTAARQDLAIGAINTAADALMFGTNLSIMGQRAGKSLLSNG